MGHADAVTGIIMYVPGDWSCLVQATTEATVIKKIVLSRFVSNWSVAGPVACAGRD
jgi:hypothetical protein